MECKPTADAESPPPAQTNPDATAPDPDDPAGYLKWLEADRPNPKLHPWAKYRARHRQRNPHIY